MKKVSNWNRKWQKTQNFLFFRIFNAIFVTFSTDFVDQNVAKRKQGTVLVQKVFRKNLMQFSRWRKSQVGTKNGKKHKISLFSMFLGIFCHDFDKLRRLE